MISWRAGTQKSAVPVLLFSLAFLISTSAKELEGGVPLSSATREADQTDASLIEVEGQREAATRRHTEACSGRSCCTSPTLCRSAGCVPCAASSPFTKSMQLNLSAGAISHRLMGGVQALLHRAEKNVAHATEICATAEVLGKSLQDAKSILLKTKPETRSPFLLALSQLNKTAAKAMRKATKQG